MTETELHLLKTQAECNVATMQNDESLSELELKSFWYKLHKQVFVPKWIWLYLSQFLTVFDEPKTQLKIFELRQPATGPTPNLGNCNRKKTGPVNTNHYQIHLMMLTLTVGLACHHPTSQIELWHQDSDVDTCVQSDPSSEEVKPPKCIILSSNIPHHPLVAALYINVFMAAAVAKLDQLP
ncbi:uncharacterized protein LACBIDRAFT_325301 [Laccaria bicolor S238N-H82]|uniref:Predicted protein n=1 Tax=Laccaria bicolor (strain S238N-H82 / ATCC MYA-4686) TaxID=486041 RepID=B0D4G9_LACBS|nr:uncharacterized protein LACBIDRAFT_325301 [Laccaria bicolor S238N-H82]EDR10341.1 predicted protein [Laccaria bicolor S238N-H82]|eukprot:XP_001878791.1 predicted protein [Laccaria bicolor S238N-H82]